MQQVEEPEEVVSDLVNLEEVPLGEIGADEASTMERVAPASGQLLVAASFNSSI
jgi:hypothetical protein